MLEDDEARRRFLQRQDVRQFAESPEGQRLLLPGLLKFLGEIGVKPMIDEATGEMVVAADAFAAALGMSEAEVRDGVGGARAIPIDRLRPLQ
jgi:hypothetical protein